MERRIQSYCWLLIFWVYLILQFCFLYEIAGIQNREHQTFVMISHSLQLSEKYKQDFKIYEGCFSWFYMDINFSRLIRNLQYPFNLIHIFLTNPTHKFYINHILIKFYPFLSLNVWLQYQLHEIRYIKTFKSFTSSPF